jgi:uncharacterized coiled-coil protein SlyX
VTGPTRAVYTALLGGYEALTEQPLADTSALPFICFTDDPELRSDTWEVRVVPPLLELDPVRSARALKLTGHEDLAAYDETLWIDARVRLTADPATILDEWLAGVDLATARHSYRANVVTEFEVVLLAGLDESSRLYEQLTHYSTLAPELLEAAVPWTAMLARRRTPEVARAMEEWLLQVLRYSRRDQLSFVHALDRVGLTPRLVELDNYRSDLHEWLGVESRSSRPHLFRVSESLRPPVAALGELRRQLDQTTDVMTRAVAAREDRIAQLEANVAELGRRLDRKQSKVRELRSRLNAERRGE